MDGIIRNKPGKLRSSDKGGAYRASHCAISSYVSVPCKVLLVPVDGYFSGSASIQAKRQSQVIGWRDLFYEQSLPRKILFPITKTGEKIIPGKASIIYDGSIEDKLSSSETRKLKLLSEKIRDLLKTEEIAQINITPKLKWILARTFNEHYRDMALASKKPVLYSSLELRLPLL